MDGNHSFLMFYITFPDESAAESLGKVLLQERLIACYNLFPINSAYWWNGQMEQAGEWVALVKTRLEYEQLVSSFVADRHPYQTPCILRFEVRANQAYVEWIYANTQPELKVKG